MAMVTTSDSVRINYEIHGTGPPVILLHSFGFDGELWVACGVVPALVGAGRSAIIPDARGHGRSDRPRGVSSYGAEVMASDVRALIDHLGFPEAGLVAFSMGSFVGLRVLQTEPRIRAAVLGGIGDNALAQPHVHDGSEADLDSDAASALLRELTPHLTDRIERGAADPIALVDVLRAGFLTVDKDFSRVTARVLLLTGTRDSDPEPVAAVLPHAQVARLDADHATTMSHPDFVPSILRFLNAEP